MTAATLLHWLQRTTLEASLLILAVLGLRRMLGTRLSPAWRIGLWMLVGAKLMLPAFIPAGFGLGALWRDKNDLSDPRDISIISEASVYSVPSAVEIQTPAVLPHPSFTLRHSALAAWRLGTLTVLTTALHRPPPPAPLSPASVHPSSRRRSASLITHLSSQARVTTPRILLTAPGTTPALVGIRQPRLLLPSDWQTRFTDRSLRHVLLHELHHIRHRDLL
jgi:beta-lactamase regulating signal transducer with metallopeptidase domain